MTTIPKSVEDQIRDAIRAAASSAEDHEERVPFHKLANVISNPAARQLRRLLR